MKIVKYIFNTYIIAFFVALFLCIVDLIVDGMAAGTAQFYSYLILAFIVFSGWDLIRFIISKVKN